MRGPDWASDQASEVRRVVVAVVVTVPVIVLVAAVVAALPPPLSRHRRCRPCRRRPTMSDRPRPPAPNHIPLPPPPSFPSFGLVATPDDGASPYLQFHTAPSSPFSDLASPHSPALAFYTPPTSPRTDQPAPVRSTTPPVLQITIPQGPPLQPVPDPTDDPFPTADIPIDLALDDEGLSTLEKTYLFSRSKAIFHRVFIAHALPSFLEQVSPQEAIEYVLPLLSGLAMDEGAYSSP